MIKSISELRKTIRVAILWNRAHGFASQYKYCEALKCMEEIDGILVRQKIEFSLFRGFLYFATAKYEEAFKLLCEVHKMITESKNYSIEEKEYLKCYASLPGELANRKLGGDDQHPFYLDYDNVLLEKIPKRLRQNFPLRDHPKWMDGKSKRRARSA